MSFDHMAYKREYMRRLRAERHTQGLTSKGAPPKPKRGRGPSKPKGTGRDGPVPHDEAFCGRLRDEALEGLGWLAFRVPGLLRRVQRILTPAADLPLAFWSRHRAISTLALIEQIEIRLGVTQNGSES